MHAYGISTDEAEIVPRFTGVGDVISQVVEVLDLDDHRIRATHHSSTI